MKSFVSTMSIDEVVRARQDVADKEAATKNRGALQKKDEYEYEGSMYEIEGDGLAVMPIVGKIYPRATLQQAMSGGVAAEKLGSALDEIEARDDVADLLMVFDSPGGNAVGIPNVARKIREMETGTTSFAQGTMASAAYWIGSAADKVVASPNSTVGSIGVYSMLVSRSEKLEEEGLDVKIIRSAEKKAALNPSEPISDKAVKMVQEQIDTLHRQFVKEVALNRNLSEETVSNDMADGDVVTGSQAADTDFADEVATLDEVFEQFKADNDTSIEDADESTAFAYMTEQYEKLRSEHKAALDKVASLKDQINELKADQREAEIERVLTQAIEEDQKVKPGKRDKLRSRLEDDLEGTKEMLALMDAGSAAPSSGMDLNEDKVEQNDPATRNEAVRALREAGIKVATDDSAADTFDGFRLKEGQDWVREEDAIEAARERDLL